MDNLPFKPTSYFSTESKELKTLICPRCKDSAEIKAISSEIDECKISYLCRNNHQFYFMPLISSIDSCMDYTKGTKIKTKCKEHKGKHNIPYYAYCDKCKINICEECATNMPHALHLEDIYTFRKIIPKKNKLQQYEDQRRIDINELDELYNLITNWLDELKKKLEYKFKNFRKILELQRLYAIYFCDNNKTLKDNLNVQKVNTLRYLMDNIKVIKNNNINNTNQFIQFESILFDFIGLDIIKDLEINKNSNYNNILYKQANGINQNNVNAINSDIVKSYSNWNIIFNFFPKRPIQIIKLYSALNDKGSSLGFHKVCDNVENLLTIIRTDNGSTIGGYSSMKFYSSKISNVIPDDKAFIFNLSKQKKYMADDPKDGIGCYELDGPFFGNTINGIVLYIADDCLNNHKSFTRCVKPFGFPDLYDSKNSEFMFFKVNNYEVFKIIFEI